MAKKPIDEVDAVLDAIDPVEEAPKGESEAKAKFRKIIEEYKVQNPVKYELKKDALEAKLNTL